MEFLEGGVLGRHLIDRYARNPRGWSFVISPSRRHSFFDGLFSGPDETWLIKLDSIFKPNPLTLGTRTDSPAKRFHIPGTLPFGYRKLDPSLAMELLRMVETDDEGSRRTADLGSLLRSVEPSVPLPGHSYAQGPFVYSQSKLVEFTDSEKTLDDRLTSELLRLMRQRYPSYG